MSHTLITVLGKVQARPEDKKRRYQKVDYDFGDGRLKTTEFFGLALAEHIRPDRLVILGTTGKYVGRAAFLSRLGDGP